MKSLTCFVMGLLAPVLAAQVHYNAVLPWAHTATSGPDAQVPGWWINLGITGVRVELMPSAPRHLLVRYVFPGSPAAGLLQIGDVVTGAGGQPFQNPHLNGYGPAVFGADGPVEDFATALAAAQTTQGGGNLAVALDRQGQSHQVTIPVGVTYGDFSATFPANCSKCDIILGELLDYLVAEQLPSGSWGIATHDTFAPLALMSSSDPAHQAAVAASVQFHLSTTKARDAGPLVNWRYMAAGIVLSEHYLITRDAAILPELQEIYDFLEYAQYLDKSQVVPGAHYVPATEDDQYGGWGHAPGFRGYGPIGMLTGQGALVYALLHRCGIEVRRPKHDAAYAFLRRGTGPNGYVWYGDQVANPTSWAAMGRTGTAALAALLAPYSNGTYQADGQAHANVMGAHPESFPDTHGSPIMGMGYCAAGAYLHGNNFRQVMDANKWWFTLSHCHDGTYYYQPNRDNSGYGSDSRVSASAVTAFIFSIPQRALVVTGR